MGKVKNKSEFIRISNNLSILLLPIDKNLILHANKNQILCIGNNHYELFFIAICEAHKENKLYKDWGESEHSVQHGLGQYGHIVFEFLKICFLKFSVPQEAK